MTSRLIAITYKAPDQYSVQREREETGQTLTFDFIVDGRDNIDVVQWSDEFSDYVEANFGPVRSLLEAVLRFHQARKVDYP